MKIKHFLLLSFLFSTYSQITTPYFDAFTQKCKDYPWLSATLAIGSIGTITYSFYRHYYSQDFRKKFTTSSIQNGKNIKNTVFSDGKSGEAWSISMPSWLFKDKKTPLTESEQIDRAKALSKTQK